MLTHHMDWHVYLFLVLKKATNASPNLFACLCCKILEHTYCIFQHLYHLCEEQHGFKLGEVML